VNCFPTGQLAEIRNETEFIAIYCEIPESQMNALETNDSFKLIDAFAYIGEKPRVEELVEKQNKKLHNEESGNKTETEDRLNIIILGIDGISRHNFQRIMPRVHNYLIEYLGAIELRNYVRIGGKSRFFLQL